MKKLGFLLLLIYLSACKDKVCNCARVISESTPQNNYKWTEIERVYWDTTCEDELLDFTTVKDQHGQEFRTSIRIICQ